jgi:hypothetical protein
MAVTISALPLGAPGRNHRLITIVVIVEPYCPPE